MSVDAAQEMMNVAALLEPYCPSINLQTSCCDTILVNNLHFSLAWQTTCAQHSNHLENSIRILKAMHSKQTVLNINNTY